MKRVEMNVAGWIFTVIAANMWLASEFGAFFPLGLVILILTLFIRGSLGALADTRYLAVVLLAAALGFIGTGWYVAITPKTFGIWWHVGLWLWIQLPIGIPTGT